VDAGSEFLTLEVTNKALSTMARTVNQRIAELQNQAKNLQTYDGYQAEYSNQNCAMHRSSLRIFVCRKKHIIILLLYFNLAII